MFCILYSAGVICENLLKYLQLHELSSSVQCKNFSFDLLKLLYLYVCELWNLTSSDYHHMIVLLINMLRKLLPRSGGIVICRVC